MCSRGADRPLSTVPVVVCAPNAFKGTLDARAAATALAIGVREAGGRAIVAPVADGGDGTLTVLLTAHRGSSATFHQVTGPSGGAVRARLGRLASGTAVIELAEASGLGLVDPARLDALHATSRGTGELIRVALDAGCRHIVVGVGGSACTDGGAGILQALGAHLTDSSGKEIGFGGGALDDLSAIDLSGVHPALTDAVLEVACDIRSPLLGSEGAARMFAAQKGASPAEVERLERALGHLASVVAGTGRAELAQRPGAGAAGGCGFGLALVGGRLLPGARLVCDMVGLDAELDEASLAITGEGRLDAQTRTGKAPAEVAARARAHGIPCVAVCGTVLDPLSDLFTAAVSLEEMAPGFDRVHQTMGLLRQAAARITQDALGIAAQ